MSRSWPLTLAALSLALSAAQSAANGGPLITDDRQSFDSKNGRFFAMPGPKKKSTIIFRRNGAGAGSVERLWEMPGWHDWPDLSDDGEYLVWCRGGPSGRRSKSDEAMVWIFNASGLVAAIPLRDLVLEPKKLALTLARSFPWGDCKGFVGLHDFSLVTLESRRLIYDVTTGKLAEEVFVDRGKPRSETTMDDLWDDPPIGRTLPTSGRKAAPPESCCREGLGGRPANPRAPAP